MYRHLVPALFALCVSLPSLLAAQVPPDSIKREIVELNREINEAMFLRRDAAPLEQVALDDLVVIPPGGFPETKDQVIRGTQNFRIDSISYSDLEVRVHGSTAVLTTRLMLHGQLHGVDPVGQRRQVDLTGPYRQMSVFVSEQGHRYCAERAFAGTPAPELVDR